MFDMVIIIFVIGGDERKCYVLLSLFCLPVYDLKCGDTYKKINKLFKGLKHFQTIKNYTHSSCSIGKKQPTNQKNLKQPISQSKKNRSKRFLLYPNIFFIFPLLPQVINF